MICRRHLRKVLRLGAVGFVATGANDGRVELRRYNGRGIVGMLGLSSVAGFAGHNDVLALLLLIDHVRVAGLAGVVAGEGNRAGRRSPRLQRPDSTHTGQSCEERRRRAG